MEQFHEKMDLSRGLNVGLGLSGSFLPDPGSNGFDSPQQTKIQLQPTHFRFNSYLLHPYTPYGFRPNAFFQ